MDDVAWYVPTHRMGLYPHSGKTTYRQISWRLEATRLDTTQHNTAQRSLAQRSAAQHNTTQHNKLYLISIKRQHESGLML